MMTTAITKPKLKSRVAAVLARDKAKPARKRKAARTVPVAKAEAKKVSGRTQKKKVSPSKPKARVKPLIKSKRTTPVKTVKAKRVSHSAQLPLKRKINGPLPARRKVKKVTTASKPAIKPKPVTIHKPNPKPQPLPMTETTVTEIPPMIAPASVPANPNLSDKALHDYKLVRRAIDHGDQKAFAELMSRYKDSIYFMLLKMVNNRDDAEDLTIEAFGKAFKNIRQYTPDYAFSTWLFKIATNNCIDFIRKKRKQAFSIDRGFENDEGQEIMLEVKSQHPDPEEHYMKKQKVEMMRDVVDKLKPRYKKLVELRYFQELAYEEIAVELNLPLGTVKAQLFRAREFLYQIMKNSAHHI